MPAGSRGPQHLPCTAATCMVVTQNLRNPDFDSTAHAGASILNKDQHCVMPDGSCSSLLTQQIGAGVSILDKDQHRFRALAGKPRFDCSRDLSFCGWSLLEKEPEVLVIEDLLMDPR